MRLKLFSPKSLAFKIAAGCMLIAIFLATGIIFMAQTDMVWLMAEKENLLFGLAASAIFFLLVLVMVRYFFKPLAYLVEKTRAIAGGDLSQSITVTTEDEIGQLARTLEAMRLAVQESEQELKANQELFKQLSLHDQLTGLYNRTYLEEELVKLELGREYPVTIICADLDCLKLINDSVGHQKGDDLLKACAGILAVPLRKTDLLVRVGGDEFIVVLPRTHEQLGSNVISRIQAGVEKYNEQFPQLPMSISLGVATTLGPEQSLEETIKKADDLMYRDKLFNSTITRNQLVNNLLAELAERDHLRDGHADRLQKLCQKTGWKTGLAPKQIEHLTRLAHIHDLGKVGIPDSILFKNGILTQEEWKVMRQHAEMGYRIASAYPDLAEVADLILRHHEKWDGTGYPMGLKGEEIPVECRILAIADAYDAITRERPYRKARSKKEAIEEIRCFAGTQFDPELVKQFIAILNQENICATL